MGRIAVTGSVAFDTIMLFRGRFADHILPEKTHLINLSFQVDSLERHNGGTAANVCYTLALLGQRPLLCAAVGAADFNEYGVALEAAGVDTSRALRSDDGGTVAGNDYELEMIRGRTGVAVEALRKRCLVAVTRGAEGSRIHTGGTVVSVPIAPISELVDPTGAGDAYLAALLAGLRSGATVKDA